MEKPLELLVDGYSNTAIFRKMAFVGDSLSSGEFETVDENGVHGFHDLYEHSWGQYLARKNGLLGYNFSRGGMTAKWFLETFADENDFWNKDKAAGAYVFALGVNDLFHQGFKVGSAEDITKTEFEGDRPYISYYAEIVRRYKEIAPDAKFFFVTLPKDGRDKEITENQVRAMYDLAEHFSNSYVIDLYKYGEVYDNNFRNKYFLHGHMNPMGYIYTARIIDSYIDYIIRQNPRDFVNAGLIGTGIKY